MEAILMTLFIIAIFVFMVRIPINYRRKKPNDFTTGIIIAVIFGPLSQLYLPKSTMWCLGLLFLFGAVSTLTNSINTAGCLTWIVSIILFVYRFKKLNKATA